jgi:hypothetical protein
MPSCAEEDPRDIRDIAEKADRLVALQLHVSLHHDSVAALPFSSNEDTADVCTVKLRRQKKQFKKSRSRPPNLLISQQQPQLCAGTTLHSAERPTSVSPRAHGRKTRRLGWHAFCRSPSTLFFITDSLSHKRFLVDSGSSFSIAPFSSTRAPTGLRQLPPHRLLGVHYCAH